MAATAPAPAGEPATGPGRQMVVRLVAVFAVMLGGAGLVVAMMGAAPRRQDAP